MTETKYLTEKVISFIQKNVRHHKLTYSRNEIHIKCPYCGRNSESYHFYIKLDIEENSPIPYYCQKCHETGILTENTIDDITEFESLDSNSVYDSDDDILEFLKSYNKNSKISEKKIRSAAHRSDNLVSNFVAHIYTILYINNIHIYICATNKNKLSEKIRKNINYIQDRLGIVLSEEDIRKFRIVPEFRLLVEELQKKYKLKEINKKQEKLLDYIDKNFVGFLSSDYSYTIFRNINSDTVRHPIRYNNLSFSTIFSEFKEGHLFYRIPSEIDLLSSNFEVILSEGVFDLLGVYHHVELKLEGPNRIYSSIQGSNYKSVIENLYSKGIVNMNIKIYSDSDKDLDYYSKLKKYLLSIGVISKKNTFEVIYNVFPEEKDFGVTKDRIELKKYQL